MFFLVCFNKTSVLSSKYTHDDIERHRFSRGFFLMYPLTFPVISLSFFSFFRRSVTLVTAKKQHCGWSARTYAHLCASTRAREKRSPKILPPLFSSFSLLPSSLLLPLLLLLLRSPPHFPFFSSAHLSLVNQCFAICVLQICCFAKGKMHFSSIFSRFGEISTHIQIGGCVVPPLSVQKLMTCIEY